MVVFWNALLLTQEAEDCWGKKELAMRLDNGTVLRRKDPSDSRFYQFMKRSDAGEMTISKGKQFELNGASAVDGATFDGLGQDFGSMALM